MGGSRRVTVPRGGPAISRSSGGIRRRCRLGAEPPFGLRRQELISKDVALEVVAEGTARYIAWRNTRDGRTNARGPAVGEGADGDGMGEGSGGIGQRPNCQRPTPK